MEARYRGQSFELRMPWGADFHDAHRKRFGFAREAPVEIVNLVERVTSARAKPKVAPLTRGGRSWTGSLDRASLRAVAPYSHANGGSHLRSPAPAAEASERRLQAMTTAVHSR